MKDYCEQNKMKLKILPMYIFALSSTEIDKVHNIFYIEIIFEIVN